MSKRPSNERIKELASLPNVDEDAVFNFLGTIPSHTSFADDMLNLAMDARLYQWTEETTKAIRTGLREQLNK
jgi:hypothetical protein